MPRYKRTHDEAELDLPDSEPAMASESMDTLRKLRNMWEFASLMQYIFLFGDEVKVDKDLDIEDLEQECLKPVSSDKLAQIGLSLLKYVSSHRGLTLEIFDEYARRQYVAKAPQRNPFGELEEPAKFNDFDVFTKIRVLQQLSTWTLGNAERIRGLMPDDEDHLNWRMEPLGWDKDDRSYFVLDDNRLYRRADDPVSAPAPTRKRAPKPAPKSKFVKKSGKKATRSSKRFKLEESSDEEPEDHDSEDGIQGDEAMMDSREVEREEEAGFGFTSKTWECVAITLDEYNDFLATLFRARDANEKELRKRIEEDVLPIIEKRAEAIKMKQLRKLRELENLQKMATAKRSSRLADKAEREVKEREDREVEEKRQRELKMVLEEQARLRKIEEGHESRRLTREQRLKEREVKRILHEEELARITAEESRAASQDPSSEAGTDGEKRISQRHLKTQKEQHQRELEKLAEDEDKWYFDCVVCGVHGDNLDDGTHSIACDKCNVWQHSRCHGISPRQAEDDDFHFVCSTCKRKEEDAKKPKIPPIKLSRNRQSASPDVPRVDNRPPIANGHSASSLPAHVQRQLDAVCVARTHPEAPIGFAQRANGPSLSHLERPNQQPGQRYPPIANFAPPPPHQQAWSNNHARASPNSPSGGQTASLQSPAGNRHTSPHHSQHQQVHYKAVVSSGGHPAYRLPLDQPHISTSSPHSQLLQHGAGHLPRYHNTVTSSQSNHSQYSSNTSTSPRPAREQHKAGPHINGFQSPVQHSTELLDRPPLPKQTLSPLPVHPADLPHAEHTSSRLEHSPKAFFPPPRPSYTHRDAQSPIKSSPPISSHKQFVDTSTIQTSPTMNKTSLLPFPTQDQHQPRLAMPNEPSQTNSVHLTPTSPPDIQQSAIRGALAGAQTPQQVNPSPASANATSVAADGMSGPWPGDSTAIPQKHDQSPAPLPPTSSIPLVNETNVVPPFQLAPSPRQQEVSLSVPVKKLPGTNGIPESFVPPASILTPTPLAPSPPQQLMQKLSPVIDKEPITPSRSQ